MVFVWRLFLTGDFVFQFSVSEELRGYRPGVLRESNRDNY